MRNIQQNIIVRFSHYSLRLEFLSCSSTGILILLAVSVVSAGNIYTENPDTYLVKLKVLQSCEHMLRLPGKYKSDLPIISCVVKQKPQSLISRLENSPHALFVAYPNVLVGHWPLSGSGQHDQYRIYGNFF